jgi:hypothetical protein
MKIRKVSSTTEEAELRDVLTAAGLGRGSLAASASGTFDGRSLQHSGPGFDARDHNCSATFNGKAASRVGGAGIACKCHDNAHDDKVYDGEMQQK